MVDIAAVRAYLMGLQDSICAGLEGADGRQFDAALLEKERGGLARPRVLSEGAVLERAAVNFSHARGDSLPPAATARRPEMAGRGFEAVSTSLIIHPRNPYAPTAHANFRCFVAEAEGSEPLWWFGGGFDLTPFYGFEEDAIHWHREARAACAPFGDDVYPKYKAWCDEYFFLKHRGEARGIGGLFFDDVNDGGFERCFALVRSIGDRFLPTYLTILNRRKDTAYTERERQFQLYRRGRYVEFNLIYDRGTLYGLQSGGRVESILASMPPLVRWVYDYHPEPGTPEARLYTDFLPARDWLASESEAGA